MLKEGKLPFVLKDRPMRIGVVPRGAASADEVRWFASEPVMCFHTCNGARRWAALGRSASVLWLRQVCGAGAL